MKIQAGQSERCVEALRALYAPPMSREELVHYNCMRASEMARAEARRRNEPQLELEALK